MDFEEDRTNCQGAIAKAQTKNTKLLSYQEVIDKIEQEYGTFSHYNIIVEKVVKYFADINKDLDERITQSISYSDYHDIINEVKGKTIAEIKEVQTEILDFQDIETKMHQEAMTKIEAKIIDGITERYNKRYNKIEEKIRKQEYELSEAQAKLNESKTEKAELLRKTADSFEQERKLFKKGRKLPQQIRQSRTRISEEGDLSQKLANYNKILEFMNGERGLELEERLLRMAKGKTKEDIILEVKDTILKMIDLYQEHSDALQKYEVKLMIFHIIAFNIISEPEGKKFIFDNFSKIIQFGFKNGEPQDDLVQLIKIVANKLKVDKKLPLNDDMEANYQHVLSQHKEICDHLEKLKKKCSSEEFYKEFYVFIDFIYKSVREKEEQDKEKELQAEKAARELLEEAAEETGCKPKQPQQKKKKKKSKSQNKSKVTVNVTTNEPKVQDSKEEFEDEEVKELRGELKELRGLRFPDKKSEEFEDKINKAIVNHQRNFKMEAANIDDEKIKNLYVIKISFCLSCVAWNINCYNKQYGKIIKQTKDDFGKKEFNPKHNKHITSHLTKIALMVRSIDTNLKEAISMLNKMTPLVYTDYSEQNDEALLEIIGQEYRQLVGEFSDHLKALEEWHDNKLHVVKEHKIYSKTKNDQERVSEKEALNIIKSCIDSLDTFVDKLGYTQDSNVSDSNVKSPMECYGSYQSQEDDNSHKKWCILHNVNVKNIHELSLEMRDCSCKL